MRGLRVYRQMRREVDVYAQGKAALFGGQAAGPVRGAQRNRGAVDDERELVRQRRRQLAEVGVALGLGGDPIGIGVGSVQLAQRRQLAIDDDVVQINGAAR